MKSQFSSKFSHFIKILIPSWLMPLNIVMPSSISLYPSDVKSSIFSEYLFIPMRLSCWSGWARSSIREGLTSKERPDGWRVSNQPSHSAAWCLTPRSHFTPIWEEAKVSVKIQRRVYSSSNSLLKPCWHCSTWFFFHHVLVSPARFLYERNQGRKTDGVICQRRHFHLH